MPKYYFTIKDYDYLKALIENKNKEISRLKLEKAKSATETSETWHDNFGFEDAERENNRLAQLVEGLTEILISAEIINADTINDLALFIDAPKGRVKKKIGSYIVDNDNYISYATTVAQRHLKENFPDHFLIIKE
jgi:hypothetical protein